VCERDGRDAMCLPTTSVHNTSRGLVDMKFSVVT